jgi:signal transduction histidine kinase
MSAFDVLALLCVVVGLALLLAAGAVWHRGSKTRACLRALLDLPTNMHPMLWPERAQHILQAAGITGLRWEGQWFGDPVRGQWGVAVSPLWPGKMLDAGPDCQIQVAWAALARTNEARMLALAVLDVFAQAWLAHMRAHTQAVAVALAQRAAVHLYWQHDMRNLAQWVGMLAEEFEEASPEQLPRLAKRLQQQAPLVLEKAHRLLAATSSTLAKDPLNTAQGYDTQDKNPTSIIRDAALLSGLEIQIFLDGKPCDPQEKQDINHSMLRINQQTAQALERALDNLLSNIVRDSDVRVNHPPLALQLRTEQNFLLAELQTPHLKAPWPERPFEPLQLPSRSGLGLYQARRNLRDVHGDFQATPNTMGVLFSLRIPLRTASCKHNNKCQIS